MWYCFITCLFQDYALSFWNPCLDFEFCDQICTFFWSITVHCEFLEHWNSQKSLSSIWQHFSCLLDEGIAKIWIFSRWLFMCHNGQILDPKNIFGFIQPVHVHLKTDNVHYLKKPPWNFFCIFLQSPHQVDMKNVVKCL